jgi:hypothetical protein
VQSSVVKHLDRQRWIMIVHVARHYAAARSIQYYVNATISALPGIREEIVQISAHAYTYDR